MWNYDNRRFLYLAVWSNVLQTQESLLQLILLLLLLWILRPIVLLRLLLFVWFFSVRVLFCSWDVCWDLYWDVCWGVCCSSSPNVLWKSFILLHRPLHLCLSSIPMNLLDARFAASDSFSSFLFTSVFITFRYLFFASWLSFVAFVLLKHFHGKDDDCSFDETGTQGNLRLSAGGTCKRNCCSGVGSRIGPP
jgi:hypothetical protein